MAEGETVFKHDPEQPVTQGWHLDKRISLAHFFATISAFAAVASFVWAVQDRVTIVEERQKLHEAVVKVELEGIKERDRQMIVEMNRQYQEIRTLLARIEDKVDRHTENGHPR